MDDPEIDESKLPEAATLDTGVLLRGLGQRRADASAPVCRALWAAMQRLNNKIYIAAPSIAEFHRGDGRVTDPKPAAPNVIVLAFDERAAQVLGIRMPNRAIQHFSKQTGEPRDYVKYDAIIIACAIRFGVTPLISLDDGQIALANKLGVEAYRPEHYVRKSVQTSLPFKSPEQSSAILEDEEDQSDAT